MPFEPFTTTSTGYPGHSKLRIGGQRRIGARADGALRGWHVAALADGAIDHLTVALHEVERAHEPSDGWAPAADVVVAARVTLSATLRRTTGDMLRRFNALLRERGILKGESKYYVSLAHTPEDIRFTREAWASALREMVRR
jgi:hypothetical protein